MTYQEPLREAFRVQKIERVAIVDDGYDPPSPEGLSESDAAAFRTHLEDAIEDGDPEGISGQLPEFRIASLEEVRERACDGAGLRDLWQAYRSVDRSSPLGKLLHRLFATFAVDRNDKLRALEGLERMILDVCGRRPATFDSQAQPKDLAGHDLIFLDFYLEAPSTEGTVGPPEAEAASRQRSLQFLKDLVDIPGNPMPLVMLISSAATADDIPEFRRHANILASAVQFMPKRQVEDDALRAGMELQELVERRQEVTALSNLMAMWRTGVQEASEELMHLVRDLDLPDYGYLYKFRLTNERVPLAHYLVWLLNGYLSDSVERRLHVDTATKLVGSLARAEGIPGRVAPTEAISILYSGITTSTVPMGLGEFQPRAWAGDVFVREDIWRKVGGDSTGSSPFQYPMPEVFAVVTPACDLVPGRSGKLRTVTTIGGSLEALEAASDSSTHFLMIQQKPFHVSWDPKWPMTIPIEDMEGGTALGGRYRWIGRLRELYHAELQHTLTADIGRVGLPVAPPLPRWSGVRVLARLATGYEQILVKGVAERNAWTIFSSTKKGSDKTIQFRQDFVWNVRACVLERIGSSQDKHSVKLREKVETAEFIKALQHPIPLRKDANDLSAIGVRIKMGEPGIHSETGKDCTLALVIVFGDDADAPKEGAAADGAIEGPEVPSALVQPAAHPMGG